MKDGAFKVNRHQQHNIRGARRGEINGGGANDWRAITFNVDEDDMKLLQGSYMSQAVSLEVAINIQGTFHRAGIFSFFAKPMGNNLVLMTAIGDEDLTVMLMEEKEILSKWFQDIRPWSPLLLEKERFAWMNIIGVPLHT